MGGTWQKRELWTIKYHTDCRTRRMENKERICQKNDSMKSRAWRVKQRMGSRGQNTARA